MPVVQMEAISPVSPDVPIIGPLAKVFTNGSPRTRYCKYTLKLPVGFPGSHQLEDRAGLH